MLEDGYPLEFKKYQEEMDSGENKRFGCLFIFKSCFFIFLILAVVGVVVGNRVYKSFKEGISLGISYTQKDFDDFVSAVSMDLDDNVESLCFTCPVLYEGEQDAKVRLINKQATAWVDKLNTVGGYVNKTQVKFEENKIIVATDFYFQGQKFPVSASGNMVRESNRSVSIDLYELEVGTIPMPDPLVSKAQEFLTDFTNDKLNEIDSFRMDKFEIGNGYLEFEGVIPKSVRGY